MIRYVTVTVNSCYTYKFSWPCYSPCMSSSLCFLTNERNMLQHQWTASCEPGVSMQPADLSFWTYLIDFSCRYLALTFYSNKPISNIHSLQFQLLSQHYTVLYEWACSSYGRFLYKFNLHPSNYDVCTLNRALLFWIFSWQYPMRVWPWNFGSLHFPRDLRSLTTWTILLELTTMGPSWQRRGPNIPGFTIFFDGSSQCSQGMARTLASWMTISLPIRTASRRKHYTVLLGVNHWIWHSPQIDCFWPFTAW